MAKFRTPTGKKPVPAPRAGLPCLIIVVGILIGIFLLLFLVMKYAS